MTKKHNAVNMATWGSNEWYNYLKKTWNNVAKQLENDGWVYNHHNGIFQHPDKRQCHLTRAVGSPTWLPEKLRDRRD